MELMEEKKKVVAPLEQLELLLSLKAPPIETDDDLFEYAENIALQIHKCRVTGQYILGWAVNSYMDMNRREESSYGKQLIVILSDRIGISKDTLYKSCQFAKMYTPQHVKEILTGKFVVSWNVIRIHLSVSPGDLIKIYKQSSSLKDFNRRIAEHKKPNHGHDNDGDEEIYEIPTKSAENGETSEESSEPNDNNTRDTDSKQDDQKPSDPPESDIDPKADQVEMKEGGSQTVEPSDDDQFSNDSPAGDPNHNKRTSYLGGISTEGQENPTAQNVKREDDLAQGHQKHIKILEQNIRTLEAEKGDLQKENDRLEGENVKLEIRLASLETENRGLKSKVEELSIDNDLLIGQIADLEGSLEVDDDEELTELAFEFV
jgi:hypothetical protein